MKRMAQAVVCVLALFILMLGINKVRFRYDWENTFWRTVMTPFTGTVWSQDFSETNFAKIRRGMPASKVEALVGKPLRQSCNLKGCFWAYTGQDTDTADSDRRWIFFDVQNHVVQVRHEFHID